MPASFLYLRSSKAERSPHHGEMAERSKAIVLKTIVLQGTQGSNPCLSSIDFLKLHHHLYLDAFQRRLFLVIIDFKNDEVA